MGLRRCFQDRLGGWDFGHLEMNQSQIPWEKRDTGGYFRFFDAWLV